MNSCFFYKILRSRLFLYTLLVITLFLSMEILYQILGIFGSNELARVIRRIVDAMLLALPCLWFRKKYILFTYLLLIVCYLLAISCYFKTYHTIMPLSSFLMLNNLKGLGPSILSSIHRIDFLLFLPTTIFVIFYCIHHAKFPFKEEGRRLLIWCRFGCVLVVLVSVLSVYSFPKEYHRTPSHLFTAVELKAFKQFGLIHFWIFQLLSYQNVSLEKMEYVDEFMVKNRNVIICPDTLPTKRNLILILVESLGSWPINLLIEDVEITPYLNQLIRLQGSLYFSKVLPQVKNGRSSDAQLLLNTGLLPLNTGAAAALCGSNCFYSLPKALQEKGYKSVSFICEKKIYWNQDATSKAYGFDTLYDDLWKSGEKTDADKQLFAVANEKLKTLNPPFYAQIVTYSSHQPYSYITMGSGVLSNLNISNDETKYYLMAINEVDRRIGHFLEDLKNNGLYDNSVIVVTGDHGEVGLNSYEGRAKSELMDRFIPLIILNTPLSADMDQVVGQVDIYPSLLNLMGKCDYAFTGLGQSVFGRNDSCAVYHTGEFAGNSNDSIVRYKRELWEISDILLRGNYFKKQIE